jgi:serine/threonine protein phosphatase PrpC
MRNSAEPNEGPTAGHHAKKQHGEPLHKKANVADQRAVHSGQLKHGAAEEGAAHHPKGHRPGNLIMAGGENSSLNYEYAVCSTQGQRDYQEDCYYASGEEGLFGVMDGHGGKLASALAKRLLPEHWAIVRAEQGFVARTAWPKVGAVIDSCFGVAHFFVQVFALMEQSYESYSAGIPDFNGSHRSEGREGSTVCAAYISEGLISVANVGDSRCVLGQRSGRAIPMSFDHDPTDPAERARLRQEGFTVVRGRIYEKATGKGTDARVAVVV